MMFDEESKKRTSEYIFGVEPKHSNTPARKSKVAKELRATELMEKIISDSEYMKEQLQVMNDKLKKLEDDHNYYDGEDTVEEEALWNEVVNYIATIAEKIDIYTEDVEFYLKGIKAVSAKMHAEVGEWR